MELTVTAIGRFSSSHEVPGHARCGRLHGHRWPVSVTIRAGMDPAIGFAPGGDLLMDAVRDLCRELDYDDLATMLPGSPATPEGVAYAFRERLAMTFKIVQVEVTMDDELTVTLR